jgi:hypothetical protein
MVLGDAPCLMAPSHAHPRARVTEVWAADAGDVELHELDWLQDFRHHGNASQACHSGRGLALVRPAARKRILGGRFLRNMQWHSLRVRVLQSWIGRAFSCGVGLSPRCVPLKIQHSLFCLARWRAQCWPHRGRLPLRARDVPDNQEGRAVRSLVAAIHSSVALGATRRYDVVIGDILRVLTVRTSGTCMGGPRPEARGSSRA